MNANDLDSLIYQFKDKTCGCGATEEELLHAEVTLSVKFPKDFRHFLHKYGWCRFSHDELYGLGIDIPMHLHLIKNTIAERELMRPFLPLYLIPFYNDGAGNHYCIDTSTKLSELNPVVFWDHEEGDGQESIIVANCFNEWLAEMLKNLVQ